MNSALAKILTTPALARAPIGLYRRGLGWLLGSRIMMLTHTGRTSGLARYVCLEVVERPDREHLMIASGLGTKSQWYRNLLADSSCRVSCGTLRDVAAVARPLSEADSFAVLMRYADAHPAAWRRVRGAIEKAVNQPVENLPVVELTLAPGEGT